MSFSELNGRQITPENSVTTQEIGLTVWGNEIHKTLDHLQCPECGDKRHITIVVGQHEANFGTHLKDVCHIEFFELVNSKLRPPLEMQT